MKFIALLGLSASVFSITCNPKTQVGLCATKKATGVCNFEPSSASHGAHVNIQGVADDTHVQICGPGKFTFSPMTCEPPAHVGSHFAYKAESFEIKSNENQDCREMTLQHPARCYAVDCTHIGLISE